MSLLFAHSTPLNTELGDTLVLLCENISNLFIQVQATFWVIMSYQN